MQQLLVPVEEAEVKISANSPMQTLRMHFVTVPRRLTSIHCLRERNSVWSHERTFTTLFIQPLKDKIGFPWVRHIARSASISNVSMARIPASASYLLFLTAIWLLNQYYDTATPGSFCSTLYHLSRYTSQEIFIRPILCSGVPFDHERTALLVLWKFIRADSVDFCDVLK